MLVKVKYTKQLDNGALKRVTEPYLLAAMTFTDAEAGIYKQLDEIIRGEFMVCAIQKAEYHDIIVHDDCGVFHKAVIHYDNYDGDTDKATRVTQNFLVESETVKIAGERLDKFLDVMITDYSVKSISLSPIVDIFPYEEELDKEVSRSPEEDSNPA
jgi:hypothetical protein